MAARAWLAFPADQAHLDQVAHAARDGRRAGFQQVTAGQLSNRAEIATRSLHDVPSFRIERPIARDPLERGGIGLEQFYSSVETKRLRALLGIALKGG